MALVSYLDIQLLETKRIEGKKLYAIKFCNHIPSLACYFATAGSNILTICRVNSNGVEVVQRHADSNASAEDYWACCWASVNAATPVVVVAGNMGILRVVNVLDLSVATLIGHGDSVNELILHPTVHDLVFSASKDRSIRLWSLSSMLCIAIFGGDKGHKDDILSIDVNLMGNLLVSSSVDTNIKVWNLADPALRTALKRADEYSALVKADPTARAYKVLMIQAPLFSTDRIHRGYVDSVRWMGDCLLTKSTNQRMVLWSPDANRYKVMRS